MLTLMLVHTRIRFAPSGYRSSLRAKREDANLPGEDLILMRAHGDSSASSVTNTFANAKNRNNSFLMVARRVARPWAREKSPVRRTAKQRDFASQNL
jgi:hypothetical protein